MPSLSHAPCRDCRAPACLRQVRSVPPASSLQSPAPPRRGLTVIEMLIATAITLVMMAAVVNLFANLSDSIRNRRAVIEVASHLRQVRQRLARDLAGCTVPLAPQGLVPWQRAGEAIGYFEIVEGDRSDDIPSDLLFDANDDDYPDGIDVGTSLVPGSQLANADNGYNTDARALGDADDVLALTVRSDAEPFVAQIAGNRVQSNLAEVVWYVDETQPDDPATTVDESQGREPGMRRIFRHALLIAPWLPPVTVPAINPSRVDLPYDGKISVHREPVDPAYPAADQVWVPNTLADLTRREYRFAHELDYSRADLDYPHDFDLRDIRSPEPYDSQYLLLNDALAFDVRVFDPGAPLFQVAPNGSTPTATSPIVQPGDAGWDGVYGANPLGYNIVGFGAYVDLGWNNAFNYRALPAAPQPHFQIEHKAGWHPLLTVDPTLSTPNPANSTSFYYRGSPAVYDTWTWHYENDRLDHDLFVERSTAAGDNNPPVSVSWPNALAWRKSVFDQGTNGIDDDGANGVDDVLERETSPPYNHALRGVKVLIRLYERDARQVREASVTHSFVP